MKTRDFARRDVCFEKASPISGRFDLTRYPFLGGPMDAADDVRVKRLVVYKASSAMGTVLGQIINLKRIVCDVGDQKMVCQTDDDAGLWSKTRGKEWVRSNADAMRLLSRDKYAMNNDLWLFRHKFLEISGPSLAAAQSVQVRYLQTDESHLAKNFPPGRLIEFEKRMGGRWDRQATHITTAPDEHEAGSDDIREVHGFFLAGQQDEWCFRCQNSQCEKLAQPLWGQDHRDTYDGGGFTRLPSGDMAWVCPFCGHVHADTARDRYALVRDGEYQSANPSAPITTRSFRWSVFAAHWISWQGLAEEHECAMAAAKMGNLKPLEDWTKKRACRAWSPILPSFGEATGSRDYRLGDPWVCGENERFMGVDRQAGKADEGEHFWVLVVQYDRAGNSRRLAFRRVMTWSQVNDIQSEFEVKPGKVYCDSGYENRSTFRECGVRQWYATRGADEDEFTHTRRTATSAISFPLPYSEPILQSGIVGMRQPDRAMRIRAGRVPRGWCIQIAMANRTLYGYLAALVGGNSGRYFGIAQDFPTEYVANMPAFVPFNEANKKTNIAKPQIWKKVRHDHAWDCEIQCLVGAIREGYFPLAGVEANPEKELAETA